jgi:predicted 3-demethylubiquinone-9 3-methyltransferase (glyoxalase superfamily)
LGQDSQVGRWSQSRTDDFRIAPPSIQVNALTRFRSQRDDRTMPTISTFLWFDTQAEEAARFYTAIFKSSRITRISHYPEGAPYPAGSVMTVEFELDGHAFVALNGGPHFTFNEAVSISVECATQQEVDEYWSKLSAGGAEGPCGWLKDRYGLSWQINPAALGDMLADPDREQAKRVFQAMMGMTKIDIDVLKRAYQQD